MGGLATQIGTFHQYRVEGLILVAEYHQKIDLPAYPGSPMVLANCFDDANTVAVLPDDRQGQYDLTQRLFDEGHRRIAFASLAPRMEASRLRMEGYQRAHQDRGLSIDPDLIVEAETALERISSERLLQFLTKVTSLNDPATVICLGNDEMAMRAYGMLRSHGFSLPEDISVAGFDNYRAIAEALYPPLTTVDLPYSEMGRRAARELLGLINNPESRRDIPVLVQGPVRWRDSVIKSKGTTKT